MLQHKLDPILIGKRFDDLIEKKYKLERELKREFSKKKSVLWNNKIKEEKTYEAEIYYSRKQQSEELQALQTEYENKKKDTIIKYDTLRKNIKNKIAELSIILKKDINSLKEKNDIKLNEKKGKLFEESHLQVIGFSDNITTDDFLHL